MRFRFIWIIRLLCTAVVFLWGIPTMLCQDLKVNGMIISGNKPLDSVQVINNEGYTALSGLNGKFSVYRSREYLFYKKGYVIVTRTFDQSVSRTELDTLRSQNAYTVKQPDGRERTVHYQDYIEVDFEGLIPNEFRIFIIGYNRVIENRTEFSMRNDILENGGKAWIVIDNHHAPFIGNLIKSNALSTSHEEKYTLRILKFRRKPFSPTIKIKGTRSQLSKGAVRVISNQEIYPENVLKYGNYRFHDIELPVDNKLEVLFVNAEVADTTRKTFSTRPDLKYPTFELGIPKIKKTTEFTIVVKDLSGQPVKGRLKILREGGHFQKVVGDNGILKVDSSFLKNGQTYDAEFWNEVIDKVTPISLSVPVDMTNQRVELFLPYKMDELLEKEIARVDSAKHLEVRKPINDDSDTMPIDLPKENLSLNIYLLGEYYHRNPREGLLNSLARPKSNFSSYYQFSSVFDLLNLFGSHGHLRSQITVLAINGIGLGVSVCPTFELLSTDGGLGLNVSFGGAISLHGGKLQQRFNGFSEGHIGVQLGFGKNNSEIDPGKFILEARFAMQGIPFIDTNDDYQFERFFTVTAGVQTSFLENTAVSFYRSFDEVFGASYFINLRYHLGTLKMAR